MEIFPCTLVFVDIDATASPNSTSKDPLSYARQALCLNKTLLHAGMPRLNVFTNAPEAVSACFSLVPEERRPLVHELIASVNVPRSTEFYAAHFKLDLLEQVAGLLAPNMLLLLLDSDIVAIRRLDDELLQLCADAGVGAFDISDQVFPAYGSANVIKDLEIVAGRHLLNPRWYGGEFLLSTSAFLRVLVPRARAHCERYVEEIERLQHHGDESFVSAALNTLADEGQQIVELGAYQAIGRHWTGNTHRDLRWFQHCCFVHLPDGKALIEREARYPDFNANRFWRTVSTAHLLNRARFGIKLCFEATSIAPQLRKMIAPGKPAASSDKPAAGPKSGPDSPEPDPFSALRAKRRLNEKSDEPVS
ncbi:MULTISPECIES: hypothetical protein [unclassified Caballeronia]|uniref:hypothetical protein n=1 Tax=unclassified Caballeronia TaxID=2646786 RepID=UPI0013ECCE75|nr:MULTISPECIES: hypothetical protein [unclassified Caballeronia]